MSSSSAPGTSSRSTATHCERIHGHNWRVAVEVDGPLDENHYVFDFIALRDLTRDLVAELDHRMLLPTESALIRLEDDGPNVVARFGDRHWSFPREECVLLPVANTTAELIADWIAGRLLDAFGAPACPSPRRSASRSRRTSASGPPSTVAAADALRLRGQGRGRQIVTLVPASSP